MNKDKVQLSRWKAIVVHFDEQNKHVNFELNEKERLKDQIIQSRKRSLILSKFIIRKMDDNNHSETNTNSNDGDKKKELKLEMSEPNIFQYSNIQEIPKDRKKQKKS